MALPTMDWTSLIISNQENAAQANLRETTPQLKFSLPEVCQVDNQEQLPQLPSCSSH